MALMGRDCKVSSCWVWLSSQVWGLGATVCERRLCIPAAASVPFLEAAPRIATAPADHSPALEDCSLLIDRQKGGFRKYLESTSW